MKTRLFIPGLFVLVLILASCTLPNQQSTPTRDADVILTAAAQTVEVQLTRGVTEPTPGPTLALPTAQLPSESPVVPTQPQPQPSNTSLPPLPSSTPQVCDRGDFVTDVTIPDGTKIIAGEQFIKTWRIKNTGTCTWTTSYSAVFDHDNLMGAPTSVALSGTIAPNQTVDISVTMKAPLTAGTYHSYWMLRNDKGAIFGLGSAANKSFYVEIVVEVGIFAVTSVTPSVNPTTFEAVCSPATLSFSADIKANRAGTVQYHWMFSDAPNGVIEEVQFTEAGTKSVTYKLELTKAAGEYTGWGAVYIDEPNHQEFSHVSYTLKCQ